MTILSARQLNSDGRQRGHYVAMVICEDSQWLRLKLTVTTSPMDNLYNVRRRSRHMPTALAFADAGTRAQCSQIKSALSIALAAYVEDGWILVGQIHRQAVNAAVCAVLARFSTAARALSFSRVELVNGLPEREKAKKQRNSRFNPPGKFSVMRA